MPIGRSLMNNHFGGGPDCDVMGTTVGDGSVGIYEWI